MSALFERKPMQDFVDPASMAPPPELSLHLVQPEPVDDPALIARRIGHQLVAAGFKSDALLAAEAQSQAYRARRVELAVAGLAGAVVTLLWIRAVDRG